MYSNGSKPKFPVNSAKLDHFSFSYKKVWANTKTPDCVWISEIPIGILLYKSSFQTSTVIHKDRSNPKTSVQANI